MKHKKYSAAQKNEIGFLISVFIVPALHFLILYVFVNINSFFLAFQTTKGDVTYWGFENFKAVFDSLFRAENSALLLALRNTVIWCVFGLFMYIPPMLTTYFVYKKVRGFKFIRIASILPTIIPGAAYVGFVKYVLAPNGVYGYLSENLFNKEALPLLNSSLYAMKTMLCYSFWIGLGFNLVWSGAMHQTPPEVLEAAQIDGVTWFQELTRIIIPLMWPTLSVNLMFTAAGLLGSTGPILLFTNGRYDTTTLSFWIFSEVTYNGNYEVAAALGALMSCISIPLVFLVRKLATNVEVY